MGTTVSVETNQEVNIVSTTIMAATDTSSSKPCFQFQKNGICSYGETCIYEHVKGVRYDRKKEIKGKKNCRINAITSTSRNHFQQFFENYPNFNYNSGASVVKEFYRMCHYFGWDREDEERVEAHDALKIAMVQEFNTLYGTDVDDIDSWHKLCLALDISPPKSLQACREKIRSLHVNLVDLVEPEEAREPIKIFSNLQELRAYTIKTGKFFPKEDAYAGGVLRFLLREILNKHVTGGQRKGK